MANICSTSYVFVGEKEQVGKMRSDLKALLEVTREPGDRFKSYAPYSNWIGYIVTDILSREWKKVYCRGEWFFDNEEYQTYTELRINTDTAWRACNEAFALLTQKYGVTMYYLSEELGCSIYVTNDEHKRYFSEEVIVCDETATEYFDSKEEALAYINETLDKEFATWEEATENAYVDEHYDIYELEVDTSCCLELSE